MPWDLRLWASIIKASMTYNLRKTGVLASGAEPAYNSFFHEKVNSTFWALEFCVHLQISGGSDEKR